MPTQSLIQMMCREMLVLEERELVSVEVKEKMEREKKRKGGGGRQEVNVFDRKMCVCGFANVRLHAYLCTCPCEREGRGQQRHGVFTQGGMMQRALAGTKVLPQDQADNPLSRKRRSKRI